MDFAKELGRKFALSAASTMGVLVVLGLWASGLESMFMKKTERIFSEKKEKSNE